MAVKKSYLYQSLWKSCDDLRGGVDPSQYKDYVLMLLFVKYVTDKYKGELFAPIEVPEWGSFDALIAAKGKTDIGERINKAIRKLTEANNLLSSIAVADFDDSSLGEGNAKKETLTKLVAIFEDLDLSKNRAGDDDLLGGAYEFLVRKFSKKTGKDKGEFYTPAEVSRVIAKVVGITSDTPRNRTVYDPTCGSGSLLIRASEEAANGLTIYGQEKNSTTAALAKMNMVLHGEGDSAKIVQGDTLARPRWTTTGNHLKRFDFAVANPPFSYKSWANAVNPDNDPYNRFEYGTPPQRRGDYAFLLHVISSLKSTGKGAVVMPHGVLFRGNAEAAIRENLIKRGLIKGVIGLPANLFYGTGIPACILVIDKTHDSTRQGIFMIDASGGFVKDGNKNRIQDRHIHRIVNAFHAQADTEGYSRFVPLQEIAGNDFNLNIPRYIDSVDETAVHDLEGHLKGGIPKRDVDALDAYWMAFPRLRKELFSDLRPGYVEVQVAPSNVRQTILTHEDFLSFADAAAGATEAWRLNHREALYAVDSATTPSGLVDGLGQDLLTRFADIPLVNRYDIYQRLMDFWNDTMEDDVFAIAQDGWQVGKRYHKKEENEEGGFSFKDGRSKKEYVAELVPAQLLIDRYFADEQAEVERLRARYEQATEEKELFQEEHTVEDGVLEGLEGSQGDVTLGNAKDRVQKLKDMGLELFEKGSPEYKHVNSIAKTSFGTRPWETGWQDPEGIFAEVDVLYEYLHLYAAASDIRKEMEKVEAEMYRQVLQLYSDLSIDEVKELVVEEKWLNTVEDAVQQEIERVTQRLAGRLKELTERYASPLPGLEEEVDALSETVTEHLKTMGVA